MEKTEPSLVPEWLRGVGGGGTAHHALHQDDPFRHRSQLYGSSSAASGEHESPRYSAYVPPRRVSGGAGVYATERLPYDKDVFSASRVYPNFSRSISYRSSHDSVDREKELHRADWDAVGFTNEGKDREHERLDGRWSGTGRFEPEFPIRRSHSIGSVGRPLENGEKKLPSESGLAPGLASSVQKAAFERNFPSLGAQEKPNTVYSSLGNVAVLSPRHLWQHPVRPGEGSRVEATSGNAAAVGSEGWTSNLAEPMANGMLLPSSSTPLVPSLNGPKMADALVQNPPRARTPPQLSAETQRLEELALKQSRQLVPMIPKATTLNSREKSKPKLANLMAPGTSKPSQSSNSQILRSPRPETPKASQGKLLLLKTGSTGAAKPDAGAIPVAPAASTVVSVVAGRNLGVSLANAVPRKQKQLLDRRAVPIPPLSANVGGEAANSIRSKDGGVSEDKRLQLQAQNRSDFFNAIRRKAASGGNSNTSEKPDALPVKNESVGSPTNSGGIADGEEKLAVGESALHFDQNGSALVDTGRTGATTYRDHDYDDKESKDPMSNGVIPGHQNSTKDVVGGSEEEEAAFLRSLGWEENAEGGEDALTEEEINAFYQEHMRSMTSSPLSSRRHNRLQNAVLGMRVGLSSVSPGISSSDSESDGEARAAINVLAPRIA